MGDGLLDRGRGIQERLWAQLRAGTGRLPAARLAPDFYRYVAESAADVLGTDDAAESLKEK